jgi:hypothetical protein
MVFGPERAGIARAECQFLSTILTGWLMGLLAWMGMTTRDNTRRAFFIILIAGIIVLVHCPMPFGTVEGSVGDAVGFGGLS